MVLTRIFRWFPGWVQVDAEGGFPETLLNEITAARMPLWNVRRDPDRIRFSCLAGDYRRLRRPARRACVRMRVRRKHGLPFHLFRYRHRRGLLVGLAAYAAILAVLAPRIWVIRVEGCVNSDPDQIAAVAQDMGVRIGARIADMDIKALEITGLDRLPELSWITVNPGGSVARIEVTEREPTPQILDLSVPSDLTALRDGRILSMTVFGGQVNVLVGEAVEAGRILVSGCVEDEKGERFYRSYGEVWAETDRRITVTVPMLYDETYSTGRVILRPTVTFLCWQIPLYGSCNVRDAGLVRSERHFLTAGGAELPLGIRNDYCICTAVRKTARSREQAAALAEVQLGRQEEKLFAQMRYRAVRTDGKVVGRDYVLTADYRCEENIALEVPLSSTSSDGIQQDENAKK